MLTYRFSQREKAMLLGLSIILVVLAWYKFVYQTTTDQITEIEAQITTTQTSIDAATTKVARKNSMVASIDAHKAAGDPAVPIPTYDNFSPLTAELNTIMKKSSHYSLSFDAVDTESGDYIQRGVGMQFNSESYETAKNIISEIANGEFPCVINSLAITNSYTATDWITNHQQKVPASATIHVTFFEKPNEEQQAAKAAAEEAASAAAAAAAEAAA